MKDNLEKQNKKVERLPIVSDYVFKRIFSYEGNEDVLKDILEGILDIKIKKVEIKNPFLLKTYKEQKGGILDIKAEVDDDKIIDIELQVNNESNIKERSTTYLGKLLAEQLQTGENYIKLKDTIVILILNFNQYERNSYHSIGRLRFDETTKETYVDMGYDEEEEIAAPGIQLHILELPKFRKKKPDMESKLDQWMSLLIGEEEKFEMAEKKNKKIKKAIETWDRISLDPEEREIYESIQMQEYLRKVSEQNFFDNGKAEGKTEEKLEIAKKLLKKNIPIEEIKEITGLDEETIKKIE